MREKMRKNQGGEKRCESEGEDEKETRKEKKEVSVIE